MNYKETYKLIDNKKIKERFLKKVDRSEKNTECHIWLASKNKTGHGMFSVMGQTIPASRYAFMMYGKFSSISRIFFLKSWIQALIDSRKFFDE